MKNLVLLLLTTASLSTFAQNKTVASKQADTTIYGLPVHKSFVQPDVIDRAKKIYGRSLYSIEKSQGPNCLDSYLVGLIKNGHLNIEWMCADPKIALYRRDNASIVLK